MTYEVASCNYEVGNSGKQWRPVGEGLCGLHDACHTAQVFVAGQQEALIPKHANVNSSKTRRQVAVNQIVLRLHASTDPDNMFHSHQILIDGFDTHTSLCSDGININIVGRSETANKGDKTARR